MRLERLDLLRYGHFTERSFDLPAADPDFHILFGPNEAGKSTALAAIEDLLFGVPMQSPYGFLHDYSSMRVGALLAAEGASLEVMRRKGNKDTLLDPEGSPLPGGEAALRPYLAGADRAFFERMFSLDHQRLRSGGREILEAKDDVGQMLFSAGSGIAGLRPLLTALTEEADGLWAPRRAEKRRFYMADDKRKLAEASLREQTLTASKWQEAKRGREEAEAAYDRLAEEIREKAAELGRLDRIRRTFRDLRRRQELEEELGALEGAVPLPEDAAAVLAEAEREDSLAAARRTTLQEKLQQAEETLETLTFDERLIRQAEEIRRIAERGIEVRSGKTDLPKREAELASAEGKLRADAGKLGWGEEDAAALAARIPPQGKLRAVRDLLSRRGKLESQAESAKARLEEARETLEELERQLKAAEPPLEVSRLAAAIRALREQGDLSGRVRNAGKALKAAEGRVDRRLKALRPAVAEEGLLTGMALPTRAEVQAHREREQDWGRRLLAVGQQVQTHRQGRDAAQAAFDRRVREEKLITPDDLEAARKKRDGLWAQAKTAPMEGGALPDELARDFEAAVTEADSLADRRFDQAEAAGQLVEIKRKIGELETLLAQEEENENNLAEEGKKLAADWRGIWAGAPFEPLAAEAMLAWLADREQVLEEIEAREMARSDWTSLESEEREAKEGLLTELAAVSLDIVALRNDSLPVVIERAAEAQQREEAKAGRRDKLETDAEKARREVSRQERQSAEAGNALEAWRRDWTSALAGLGLAAETALDAVEPSLDLIEELRQTDERIRTLRHDRIDKIKKDLAGFERAVGELAAGLADDLAGLPAEAAIARLVERLGEAEETRKRRKSAGAEAETLKGEIGTLDQEVRERAASLAHLMDLAGVANTAALKEAIALSDRQRALRDEAARLEEHLRQDGDGLSPEDLAAECRDVEIDEIAATADSVKLELAALRAQEHEAIEARAEARRAFQAIGGDAAAARAEAERQEALAEMGEVAERYVRVKTSAILLQWAIDRYRREKQAPLLKRASALFIAMTGGSFAGLEVAFDAQDRAALTGVRPGGTPVAVSGMSSGTADQLYLALRIAAIEDYLERAAALPFVADDLFINFDDARAAAGLRLLQELGRKTQVLFFTHHRHLVDIARETLGASVNVVGLSGERMSAG